MTDEQQNHEATGETEAPATAAASVVEEVPRELTPLEAAHARIQELEANVLAAEAESKNHQGRTLRVAADFENHRKRSVREVDEAKRSGSHNALSKLLPVFDNLERATSHGDAATDPKTMADGLRMVIKQFGEALGKLGLERVESVGTPFDPMLHESIQYEHHATIAAGLVSKELQAGYRQGNALMRPALVVVSKGPNLEVVEPSADAPSTEAADDAANVN